MRTPGGGSCRRAKMGDVEAILALLSPNVAQGLVLPRSGEEIRGAIADFLVAVSHPNPQAVGCVALRDYGGGLLEIRSLVVAPDAMGQGIGSALVRKAIERAVSQGATKIFALTLRPNLFLKMGFRQVDKSLFPLKVWLDCSRCRKREECDEIAVLFNA